MPPIRELDAPTGGLQTNSSVAGSQQDLARTQISAFNDLGGAVGGVARAAGNTADDLYDKLVVQKELSTGSAAFAATMKNLVTDWNDLAKSSDPNDDTIADTFLNGKLEDALTKFEGGFTTDRGKLWAQNQANQFRQHMYEKTSADTESRANLAVANNITIAGNQLASLAQSDPTSIDTALASVDDSIGALISNSSGLDGVDAAAATTKATQALKEQIVKAGFQGMITTNPEAFLEQLKGGKLDRYSQYLNGTDQTQLEAMANAQINARQADAKAAQVETVRQNKVTNDRAVISLLQNTVQPDGTLKVPQGAMTTLLNDIGSLPDMDPSLLTSTKNVLDAITSDAAAGVQVADVPEIYNDFSARAFLSPADPNHLTVQEVYQARANRQLSDKSRAFFTDALSDGVQDPQKAADEKYLTAFFDGVKPVIQGGGGLLEAPSGAGTQRFYQFQVDMRNAFYNGKAAGKSTNDLLNPTSKDYILGPNNRGLAPYVLTITPQDAAKNALGAAQPLAPILPALSADPYNENLGTFLGGFYQGAPAATPDASTGTLNQQDLAVPQWDGKETPEQYLKRVNGTK